MFDWRLFLTVTAVGSVAAAISMPRQVSMLMEKRRSQGHEVPSNMRLVMFASVVQTAVLISLLAALGTALAPGAGLSAPWFEALSRGTATISGALEQAVQALIWGGPATVLFLVLYYGFFRPRLADDAIRSTESRLEMGFLRVLLQGGVIEEILFRWGIMTVLAWAALAVGMPMAPAMWVAILIAGLLFGLGHLPGAVAQGATLDRTVVSTAIVLNMIVAVACGWLFWKHGLLAAIYWPTP